jgi:hypothetical protein
MSYINSPIIGQLNHITGKIYLFDIQLEVNSFWLRNKRQQEQYDEAQKCLFNQVFVTGWGIK